MISSKSSIKWRPCVLCPVLSARKRSLWAFINLCRDVWLSPLSFISTLLWHSSRALSSACVHSVGCFETLALPSLSTYSGIEFLRFHSLFVPLSNHSLRHWLSHPHSLFPSHSFTHKRSEWVIYHHLVWYQSDFLFHDTLTSTQCCYNHCYFITLTDVAVTTGSNIIINTYNSDRVWSIEGICE